MRFRRGTMKRYQCLVKAAEPGGGCVAAQAGRGPVIRWRRYLCIEPELGGGCAGGGDEEGDML